MSAWMFAAVGVAEPGAAAAQAQAAPAAAGSYDELTLRQSASDRMNIELDQVVRDKIARGVEERRRMAASQPIQNYLESVKAAVADEASADSSTPRVELDDLAPLVEKDLRLMEELERDIAAQDAARRQVDSYAGAKSKGVAIKLRTAATIEDWARLVVIVPPGEVIENDPIDVAHAKLEDLTRRREELQAELKTKPTSMAMRSIIRELAGIDRQINAAIFQITGVVWFHRAGKGSICHPVAVKGQPVAWHNCDYWALSTPFVVDPSGANIIVDRVLIDVTEDASGLRSARIAYYTHAHGQPPSDEPSGGATGDLRRMADGSVQLIVRQVDEFGEERERAYPIELTTDGAKGLIPGFSDYGPFKLKFKRDPKAYISWEEADAMSRGVVTSQAGKGAGGPPAPEPPSEDDFLAPLIVPDAKPPAPRPPPPPPPPASEDDDLAPLVIPK